MDWIPLDINTPAERDAVILALYHAGYTVRQQERVKDGEYVLYIEFRKDE